MRRYSIFHAPVLSFFSKAFYSDVCHRWKGVGFAYMLLLLIVCWIAPMIKVHMSFSDFVDNEAPKIVSQIPTIRIVNGKASIRKPQPYRITDPDTGQVLAVIDTHGFIKSLDDTSAVVLVKRTEAIFRKNEFETQTFSFREIERFTLSRGMITGWLVTAKKFVAPVLYVPAVLGAFVFRILQALIYACIGLLFAYWCKTKCTYASLLRLSVMAVTPGIIIETILDVAGVNVPFAFLWCFLAAMFFLFFGVKAASQDQNPTVVPGSPYGTNTPGIPDVQNTPNQPPQVFE